jgi:hypothetical protein
MLGFIVGICLLALLMPVLRFLWGVAILCSFYLAFTNGLAASAPVDPKVAYNHPNHIYTYQELVDFKPSCDQKQEQLKKLQQIQDIKNFDQDPNNLLDHDRAYNSRLKATIWWYTYSCDQS